MRARRQREETETADRRFILKNSSRGIVFESEHETFFPLARQHAGTATVTHVRASTRSARSRVRPCARSSASGKIVNRLDGAIASFEKDLEDVFKVHIHRKILKINYSDSHKIPSNIFINKFINLIERTHVSHYIKLNSRQNKWIFSL